jgi:sporulation protein YlmC with PRC-barrel domain
MDIPIHADVNCTDGLVGKSAYIVVDLISGRVTHVVVKAKEHEGRYLVPLDIVTAADQNGIQLDCQKRDVYHFSPFDEMYFNGYDDYRGSPPIPAPGVGPSNTLYHPYRMADSAASDASTHSSAVQLAIKKGAEVLAADAWVGQVDELVVDPKTHRVTHMVLRQHHLLKDKAITIPVTAIEKAEMDTVYLKIDKDAVEALPTVALKKFHWE